MKVGWNCEQNKNDRDQFCNVTALKMPRLATGDDSKFENSPHIRGRSGPARPFLVCGRLDRDAY